MLDKKALVVIDMQNDFLWKDRKPMFSYNTDELVGYVNKAISSYKENGYDIIYIKQYYANIATNRWIIGFGIEGTIGAEIYDGIDIVSDHEFVKWFPNTYTSKPFRQYMEGEGFSEVVLCGVDECGCVGATAKGAIKAGVKTYMLQDCIGCRFPDTKKQKMRNKLKSMGVEYISL